MFLEARVFGLNAGTMTTAGAKGRIDAHEDRQHLPYCPLFSVKAPYGLVTDPHFVQAQGHSGVTVPISINHPTGKAVWPLAPVSKALEALLGAEPWQLPCKLR